MVRPLPDPAPLVSVIVPTRDRAGLLAACADGVLRRTDYPAIEFLVVDNGSAEPETLALFDRLRADPRVRILAAPGPFNYSALNNQAAAVARGEILLLLNNDIEVIEPGWLRELVGHAVRPEIGAVGAKLLYADGRLQHGGVVTGVGGVADHYLLRAARDDPGYVGSLALARQAGAVTGACLALRRSVFERGRRAGRARTSPSPSTTSISACASARPATACSGRPSPSCTTWKAPPAGRMLAPEKARRFAGEIGFMKRRWGEVLLHDPFYSPWLSLDGRAWRPGAGAAAGAALGGLRGGGVTASRRGEPRRHGPHRWQHQRPRRHHRRRSRADQDAGADAGAPRRLGIAAAGRRP